MVRELVLLGTASQVPTRTRNHNGYLLRWDGESFLFDPGEGTQRQLTLAGVSAASVTTICLTHLHGDHCLGLPGVVQRLSLDRVERTVHLYFPASGQPYVERLLDAAVHHRTVDLQLHPCSGSGRIDLGSTTLVHEPLEHRIETLGWRVEEPDGRTMLPAELAARGLEGPAIGRLQRQGWLSTDDGPVTLEEVSRPRRGQRFAIVMDTAWCEGAVTLAADADLLLCEATFLDEDHDLAREYLHLTAGEAGRLARTAGAERLVLTHFSQRYPDAAVFGRQARAHADDVVVGQDLLRVELPPRRDAVHP